MNQMKALKFADEHGGVKILATKSLEEFLLVSKLVTVPLIEKMGQLRKKKMIQDNEEGLAGYQYDTHSVSRLVLFVPKLTLANCFRFL